MWMYGQILESVGVGGENAGSTDLGGEGHDRLIGSIQNCTPFRHNE